jgi:hypothetical protein
MTLCVSAFTDNGFTLISVNDLMVTFGDTMTHSPALMKSFAFNNSWVWTFAGDVTPMELVMNRFLKRIENEPNSFSLIAAALEEAYQAERRAQISAQVTGKYGMTLDQFQDYGPRQLPQVVYEDVWRDIKHFDLGTAFLIGGLDDQRVHHLCGLFNPGHIAHYTGIGYAAIGIGAEDALKMFRFRGYNWGYLTTAQSISAVIEAKVFGENPYVGKETMLIVIDFKKSRHLKYFLPMNSDVRLWIRQGKRPEAEQAIQQALEREGDWLPLTAL